jgi:hypothetical protein
VVVEMPCGVNGGGEDCRGPSTARMLALSAQSIRSAQDDRVLVP